MARRAEMILGGNPDAETITTSNRSWADQPTIRKRSSMLGADVSATQLDTEAR